MNFIVRKLGGLRCRLMLLVLFALLPLWLLLGFALVWQRTLAIDAAQQQAGQVVRLAAQEQEQLIEQAEQLLAALARVPAVRNSDPACPSILGDILPLHPAFTTIAVIAQNGDVSCSAIPLAAPVNIADRDYFQRALETRTFVVSQYLIGRATGQPSITAAYPFPATPGPGDQAMVIASIDLSWLNRLLTATALPEGGVLGMFDDHGTVLARFPDPGPWVGQALPQAVLTRTVLSQHEGFAEAPGLDGAPRFYAFAPVTVRGEARGYVYAGIPRETMVAESNRAFARGILGVGIFSLLALGLAYIAGDLLLLRRLGTVMRATQRLAAGDLSARTGLRSGPSEIAQLAASFDSMAAALQQREAERAAAAEEVLRLNADLEERVRQRTAALETANWELAQREYDLREAQALLEQLIAASPVVLFRMDPLDRTITYASANAFRITGYRPEEITANPAFWSTIIAPADAPKALAAFDAALRARQPEVECEFRFRHKDGADRWGIATHRMEYAPTGSPVGLTGALLDITDRKLAEVEVQRARVEAEQANQAKSEFLSRMSHELRTPLNAILGFAQLLELDDLNEEQREGVDQILKGGRHLLELINEVLDISRIEAGRLHLSPEPVQAAEVLQEALDLLRPLAADRAVTLHADLGGAAQRYVIADRQRLKQVVLNLLSNAVKYNRTGGTVSVSCQDAPGGDLRVTVADTGIGIAPARMAQVFEPFERLDAEQTGIEGTGLGLALSRRLVEAMHGTMGLTSEPGVGSTFWIELPLADAPDQQAGLALEQAPVAPNGHGSTATVLYIEDNLSNLRLIERLLARWPGVRLLTAMQGQLGLDLAREHRPDIVLLDLHLPDLQGDRVLQELRGDPRTRDVAVVMISADATPGQIARLLDAGAQTYLTKPLDVKRFFEVLDTLLGERQS